MLDVGCGTGKISRLVAERNPKLSVEGIDVLAQPKAEVEVKLFDGANIPFDDGVFDAVTFVDVLHHTDNHAQLLREAFRVSKGPVIVKDHICSGRLAFVILAFMDWVGNRSLGIQSIHSYLSKELWKELFNEIGAIEPQMTMVKGLYPFPFSLVYPSTGNFVAFLSNFGPSRELLYTAIASFRKNCKFPSQGGAIPEVIAGINWSDHWSF